MATFNPFQATWWVFTGALTWNTFPWLSLQKTNEIKARAKTMSDDPFEQMLIQDDLHKSALSEQNHNNFMQQRQVWRMSLDAQALNTKDPKTKNTSTSVKKMWALADMYRQYGYQHGKNWDSMWDEELISRFNTKNPQVKQYADAFLTGNDESEYRLAQQLWISGSKVSARAKLSNNLWDNLWGNMKTKASGTVDSWKKFGQRALNNLWGNVYKTVLKKVLWDDYEKITGVNIDDYIDTVTDNMIENEVMDYQNKLNQAYAEREARNVDADVNSYYEQKGYTKLLKEWDFKWFLYKAFWDMGQNWDMPVIVAASVFQPEVWFALMATDTYARENQDAFETMINNGATYEEAEKWGVVVWLINAAVEVYLEKWLGWAETRASQGIRDIFKKNIQEEITKQWAGRMLLDGLVNQLKASWEEWLEEIVQQFVQNVAVKTVNENQDLFQWLSQAFEWGFYNPMNLLVWWSNIVSGVKNSWGMSNINTQTNTNTQNNNSWIRQWILDRMTDWGAQKITGTVSAQDKLYKAQEPRMNVLSNKKNLENRRVNSDRANQLIIENGYVPTNTTERLNAHQATLNKLWGQVMDQVNQWEWVTVDQTPMIDALSEYINSKKKLGVAWIESDIRALEAELESLQKMQEEWTTDLPTLEAKKQVYNDLIDWKEQEASEVYKWGIKLLTQEIGKIEDNILSEIPWEFANLKKDVWALLDTYEDVFKADMKNQRSKGMWLTETYSRIEWIGDTLGGIFQLFKWDVSWVAKWLWKLALGKSLAKAKDVDFLIEQWFKELANQQGLDKNQASSKTAKYNDKQMEGLVNQLKKTWLAKDVILVDSAEDFNNELWDNTKFQIADDSVYQVQPLERIEEIQKNILDEYGETDNPSRVAFIDNEWRWINGNMWWYGDYRDVDHREIASTAFDDTDIEFETWSDWLVALQAQTWLVRVNYNDWYMSIDTVYELMPDQREGLMKFDDYDMQEVNVDITDPKTWRTIDNGTFASVRDAIRFIDKHFAKYLRDSNWNIAWATLPDGTVYLIKDNLRWDTPTHEFSHLLRSYARENSPSLFNALNKIAKDAPQELKDYVQKTYWDLSEDAFLDEVFAWRQWLYSGIKSAQTWYQRMRSTIVQIWNDIKNNFWSKYADLDVFEAYEQMWSEELMQKVDNLLKWWKEIWQGYGSTQFEIAWDIYSKNFKNWFGDWENWEWSKVVDENGNPLVVYHGWQNYHTEFKKDYVWSNFWQDSQWFFFTDSKQSAEDYANNTSYGLPRENPWVVMDVYLSLKNPLIERTDYDPINLWDNDYERLLKKANTNKNDWIIIKADEWESLYVAFEPNQIKSASDNVWTYDPNNPDIRYERTEGNISDLKRDYYYIIRPDYEIKSWEDANLHWALDYMLEKKWIANVGNSILNKLKALNSKLPKVKNGDEVANLSPIDQFWYDLKDKVIETYIMNENKNGTFIVKDRDHWNVWDWAYPNKTFVDMKIWRNTASLHMSEFLYTKLKEEWYIR